MKATFFFLTISLTLWFTGSASAGDATRGKQIFDRVGCWQCHGYEGQGANTGPKLAPDPMDMEALKSFLRAASATSMPPYSTKILSDDEIADIHAYLASVKKPPSTKTIPLLQDP